MQSDKDKDAQANTVRGVKKHALIKQLLDETARNREAITALTNENARNREAITALTDDNRESRETIQELANVIHDQMDLLKQLVKSGSSSNTRCDTTHLDTEPSFEPHARPKVVRHSSIESDIPSAPTTPPNIDLNRLQPSIESPHVRPMLSNFSPPPTPIGSPPVMPIMSIKGTCTRPTSRFHHNRPTSSTAHRTGDAACGQRRKFTQDTESAPSAPAAKKPKSATDKGKGKIPAQKSTASDSDERGNGPHLEARPTINVSSTEAGSRASELIVPGAVPKDSVKGARPERVGNMFRGIGLQYIRGSVAESSRRTYGASFRSWCLFRESIGAEIYVTCKASELQKVMALVDFASYCFASLGNTPLTVSNKISAVKYFHVVEAGVEMPTESPLLKCMLSGMKRASLQAVPRRRCRVPIALDVLLDHGGSAARLWGTGGRVLFLCLLLTYFIGARAHEIFKNDSGKVHLVHCLTRGDVMFFENDRQLGQSERRLATRVYLCFGDIKETSPSRVVF